MHPIFPLPPLQLLSFIHFTTEPHSLKYSHFCSPPTHPSWPHATHVSHHPVSKLLMGCFGISTACGACDETGCMGGVPFPALFSGGPALLMHSLGPPSQRHGIVGLHLVLPTPSRGDEAVAKHFALLASSWSKDHQAQNELLHPLQT